LALVRANFEPLCVLLREQYDGAAAASNRPGTCAGWSPRYGWCIRGAGPSAGGVGHQFCSTGGMAGKLALIVSTFDPLYASPRAQYNGAAAASNRPATYEGWSPGPGQVCPMLWAFGEGHAASIPLQWRDNWPLFELVWAFLLQRHTAAVLLTADLGLR
jgi:hypothetical protein